MTKTVSSRRISSAMASRKASRTVVSTILILVGISGSRATVAAAGAADAAGAAGSGVGAAAAGAGAAGVPRSAAVSPSSRSCKITAPTFTPSVPAATMILPTTPSSIDSTSIVALSVSISARISPEETVSPSFTSHFDSVPSSIVGERAGI